MYSEEQINAAISRVEIAKQNYPVGWVYLDKLGLDPSDSYVFYAFNNAKLHTHRIQLEDDPVLLYAAAWLQGLSIGHELGKGS